MLPQDTLNVLTGTQVALLIAETGLHRAGRAITVTCDLLPAAGVTPAAASVTATRSWQ
jgi:hypothetical protein